MKVGVPNQAAQGESRVSLVPDVVRKLGAKGVEVIVESGAGESAHLPDAAYEEAGASVGPADAAWGAEVVAIVRPPTSDEIGRLSRGSVLIGFLDPLTAPETSRALASAGVTAFAMEAIPRITRAQAMDALSSQSTVAGYRAVLLAAVEMGRFFPMLTTAAGTIKPASVLVLGAGVAGLQAIATARRLGSVVTAFDVRAAVREQV
ncbi:MAG: H+-translocating transhydrogenase subunit alpha, partial [Thermoleophilaceae bacterium]|nr:H+-translocating transhydrogenase subunit alpha [Thermoleophilaceae bacterium]